MNVSSLKSVPILKFIIDIASNRWLIWQLTKKELMNNYLGSFMGVLWAFVQPMVTIFVLWFVLEVGMRAAPVQKIPFILWFIAAMIPWMFFSEGITKGTQSIMGFSYLIKNIVFRASILPIVKICSALIIHLFFLCLLIGIFLIYGYYPDIYYIQILYYLLASIFLILGISWITSSLILFVKDVGEIVSVLIQIGFWATPIMWPYQMLPAKYQIFMKLNPVYYITEGYRNAIIDKIWFWEKPLWAVYFWGFTIIICIIGIMVFKKLRPHFADVI